MTSSIVPSEEPLQAVQAMGITEMDKDLFDAAANGDMKLFDMYGGDFKCLVDGRKNTALHIYFRVGLEEEYGRFHYYRPHKRIFKREINMNFIQELVKKCPSLLLQPNEEGEIPLHIAAAIGSSKIVEFIILLIKLVQNEDVEKGLEQTNRMKQMLILRDKAGNTALHRAAESGEADVVESLVKELDPDDVSFSAENEKGETPLYMAAREGNHLAVAKILDKCAFSAENKKGETPLCTVAREGNHLSVAKILDKCESTAHGGPIGTTAHGGPNGTTALHAAILGGDERKLAFVALLAAICGRGNENKPLLAAICGKGNESTVKILVDSNKDLIRETDDKGRTPLHYAAHFGRRSAVELMLKADAKAAYITDKEGGMTALHMAAWRGHKGIMKDIIKYCPGCCGIVEKKYGWNFLHFAAVTLEESSLWRILFGAKSKTTCLSSRDLLFRKDYEGITPYDVKFFLAYNPLSPPFISFVRYLVFITPIADYLRPGGRKKSEYHMMNAKIKKEQIGKIMKEIGEAELAGLQVHDSFREGMKDNTSDMKEIVNKIRESHLVVATLVATVTFTAALTVPGGYNSENGTAILSNHPAFKAFIITDALAFVTSLLAIFLYFLCPYMDITKYQHLLDSILVADYLSALAMTLMLVAFSTGTYAVLECSMGNAIATSSIGFSFLAITIIVVCFLSRTIIKNTPL